MALLFFGGNLIIAGIEKAIGKIAKN